MTCADGSIGQSRARTKPAPEPQAPTIQLHEPADTGTLQRQTLNNQILELSKELGRINTQLAEIEKQHGKYGRGSSEYRDGVARMTELSKRILQLKRERETLQ